MADIAAGDQAAFRTLTEKYRRRMLALARRVTDSAADADEILQEVFLKVWMAAPTWQAEGPARFSTWLSRVVLNASIDRKRRRIFSPLDEAADLIDQGEGGFETAFASERNATILDAMATLPDRQRSALSLHYLSEMSAPDAAKALGVSVSSLESLLVRGKRSLRDALVLANVIGLIDIL
jgi:RNA polymerase sigma-70 factor (ECF subfamily)